MVFPDLWSNKIKAQSQFRGFSCIFPFGTANMQKCCFGKIKHWLCFRLDHYQKKRKNTKGKHDERVSVVGSGQGKPPSDCQNVPTPFPTSFSSIFRDLQMTGDTQQAHIGSPSFIWDAEWQFWMIKEVYLFLCKCWCQPQPSFTWLITHISITLFHFWTRCDSLGCIQMQNQIGLSWEKD